MTDLKVFTNEFECFVARDKEHLKEVFEVWYWGTMEEYAEDADDWNQFLPHAWIVINDENPPDDDFPGTSTYHEGYYRWRATAEEWAEYNGAGFLCSTEW